MYVHHLVTNFTNLSADYRPSSSRVSYLAFPLFGVKSTVHILGCFYGQSLEQLQCCLTVRPCCLYSVLFCFAADSGQNIWWWWWWWWSHSNQP